MEEADKSKLQNILKKELELLTKDIHSAKGETQEFLIKEAVELARLIEALESGRL